MNNKISAIVHTYNEEKNIGDCLESLKWANEIIIVDMHSVDKTIEICKKYTNSIYFFTNTGIVEPARNFAISKAKNDWILVLDADERITESLKMKIIRSVNENKFDYVVLFRKNYIFGKWIKYSGWNTDALPRLFKKGHVVWSDEVHNAPKCNGRAYYLKPQSDEDYIVHYSYESVDQFIEKLNRYTSFESLKLFNKKEDFSIKKLMNRSRDEFQYRFFDSSGYKDGFHGFIVSELMRFYWFIAYLKLWELSDKKIMEKEDEKLFMKSVYDANLSNCSKFLYKYHKSQNKIIFVKPVLTFLKNMYKLLRRVA